MVSHMAAMISIWWSQLDDLNWVNWVGRTPSDHLFWMKSIGWVPSDDLKLMICIGRSQLEDLHWTILIGWSELNDGHWMISVGWSQTDDLNWMISIGWSRTDDLDWTISIGWSPVDELHWMIWIGWSPLEFRKKIKHFGCQWVRRQIPTHRKWAQSGSKYGKCNNKNSKRKSTTSGVNWCAGKSQLAENYLTMGLRKESKMIKNSVSVGARENSNSQKMSLGWTSVWKVNWPEFYREINNFVCRLVRGKI